MKNNLSLSRFLQPFAIVAGLAFAGQPMLAAAAPGPQYGYQVPLTGMNQTVTQGQLAMAPASYDFGTLVLGSSAAFTTTLKNTGQDAVTLAGFSVSAPYSQANSCPSILVGGATCSITVTYNPQAAGTHTATLTAQAEAPVASGTFALTGNAVVPTTNLGLSINTVNFADTDVGVTAASKSITITNKGNSPATVTGIGVTSGMSDFSQSNNCGSTLAPGASCIINVAFVPTVYGSRSGGLSLFESASGTLYNVALVGSGNDAVMSVSPATLDVGAAIANYSTRNGTVTVSNTGNLPMTGLSFDAGTSDFSVASTTCSAVLAPAASCTVAVKFAPTAAGARTGALLVHSTNADFVSVSLQGTGQAQAPSAQASVSSLNFSTVPVDGSSASQVVTLTNKGNVTLNVTSAALATGAPNFQSASQCGSTLAVGSSCTVTVTFTPKQAGVQTGTLRTVLSSGTIDTTLTGTGMLGEASVSASSLTFAAQQVASPSAPKTITVTNTGSRKLTFSGVSVIAGASHFAQSNNCAEVLPNGTCTVSVVFTPAAQGAQAGTLALVHDGVDGTTTVDLAGTGQSQSATLSTPAFGATSVGASSTATATLANTGIGALSLTVPTGANVSGAGYSFVSTTCGSSLSVAANCTVTLRFSPTSTTPASGGLTLATGAGPQTVSFGSTGIQGFVSVSPASLTFAAQQISSTSAAKVVTVTNTGTDTLTFTGVGISAGATDFAQSNNCGSVPVGGTCTVNVSFTPSYNATRLGTLSFTHNGGGIANVDMSGVGQAQSATLSDVNFGGVNVGSTPTLTSTLTNTGIGTLAVTPPGAGSVSSAHFSFVSTTCGSTLAAGASCSTTVRFSPSSGGAKSGTLAISTGAGVLNAALSGTGNQAVLVFSSPSTTTINWGARQVGGSYVSSVVTLTNSGNVPASGLVLTPTSVWTLASNTCGTTLAATSSCTFVMMFNPAAVQAYSGAVTAASSGSLIANQMTMTGSGVAQSGTLAAPSFPPTAVGSTNTAVATLSNTGVGDLAVTVPSAASVAGAGYSFASTTCGTAVVVSGSCTVTVRFSPTSTAAATGTLSIDTGAGTKTITLGSTGIQGYASVSPGSLTFGTVGMWATSAVQNITVTNTGTNTLTFSGVGISVNGSEFAQSNNCGSVAVNGTCTVSVSFTPVNAGYRAGTLSLTHNGGGIANVDLGGTGQLPTGSISSMGSFPATAVGSSSTAVATYTNTGIGPMPLVIPGPETVTGDAAFSFVSTNCPGWLPVGTSCQSTVRFSPTTRNAVVGNFRMGDYIRWNDAALSATGLQGGVSLAPASLTFANGTTSTTSSTQSTTLTNSGNTPLVISSVTVTAGGSAFTRSTNCVGTIAAGGTCTISSTFSPVGAGANSGTITIAHNGSGPTTIGLSGTAYVPASVTGAAFAPAIVSSGSLSNFSWTTANASSATVSCAGPASGSGSGTTGNFNVSTSGTGTATCTVTAYNPAGTPATGAANLTVVTAPLVTGASFAPAAVATGAGSTFSWSSTNATSATVSCAAPAYGSGSGTNGSIAVSTSGTGNGTCTVTAVNAAGNVSTGSATLSVQSLPTVPSYGFAAGAATVGANNPFSWTTGNATSASVSCSTGAATSAVNGSLGVSGSSAGQTVTCTVTASNAVGSTARSSSFTVLAPPSVASAYFNAGTVAPGNNNTFNWSTSNATSATVSCSGVAGGSSSGVSGSLAVSTSGTGTGTCTVTAYNGAGSSASASSNYTSMALPTASGWFDAAYVTAGGSNVFRWSTGGATTSSNVDCWGSAVGSYRGSAANGAITVTTTGTGAGYCNVAAVNPAGSTGSTAGMTTVLAPSVSSAYFSPSSVMSGVNSTFYWSTANATSATVSCSGTASGSSSGTSGGKTVATSGTGTGTCTVTAYNAANAAASGSANLSVTPSAPVASQSASYMAVTMTGSTQSSYGPYMLSDPNSQGNEYYYVQYYNGMHYNGTATFTITNTGGGSLTIGAITNNGESYRYDDPYNNNAYYEETTTQAYNCEGVVLGAGQSCTTNMSYYSGREWYDYMGFNAATRPNPADVTYYMATSAGTKSFVVSWR